MSIYNYLILSITCPRCGSEEEMEAEFRFGLRELTRYHIGDQLRWDGTGIRTPRTRPEGGNYNDEAYVVCPKCNRDFWLNISVKQDIIVSATPAPDKQPYIHDE